MAEWNTQGLPADPVSTENGVLVKLSARYPLLVDPQLQGVAWVRAMETPNGLETVRLGNSDVIFKLKAAIENGLPLLLENLGEEIDAVIMPIVSRQTIKRGSKLYLKLGEEEVSYHADFRLYLHTKLTNPHYKPEIQAETTLVNFTVTPAGLEDQLLALVVRKERPDLARRKAALVQQQNRFTIQIRALEDDILMKLATAEGDVTENQDLIEGLENAKTLSEEINDQLEQGRATTAAINETSEAYRSVARRGSLLFFLLSDLVKIHTYYIYSLNAFVVVFVRAIDVVQGKTPPDLPTAAEADRRRNLKGISRLRSMAKKVMTTLRFNWNVDALREARMNSTDDDKALEADHDQTKSTDDKADAGLSALELSHRRTKLMDTITSVVFDYVRRGLFESAKLTVATMVTFAVLQDEGRLDPSVVAALLTNRDHASPDFGAEVARWLPEAKQRKLKAMEVALGNKEPSLFGLADKFKDANEEMEAWYLSARPEEEPLGGELASASLTVKLLLVRALRPDRVVFALSRFIVDNLGQHFVTQAPFDMVKTYQESSPSNPVFFVLFAGVDPTPWVEELGHRVGISSDRGNLVNISMGQGQEKPAEAALDRIAHEGGWIMLQNLHLMQTWLPALERKLEVLSETAHRDFRCFCSAEPPPMPWMGNMPESLLQSCIKVANEAPADFSSNLSRAWSLFQGARAERLNSNGASVESETAAANLRACMYGLSVFHALVLGRRRFGQQGWSRRYAFNNGDLLVCADVLENYLSASTAAGQSVPLEDLRYIFGEIMYGGHITDFWDRRTNNTYLEAIFDPALLGANKTLAEKLIAPDPVPASYESYTEVITGALPPEHPSIYGLHPNVEIAFLTESAESLFSTILRLNAGVGGAGGDEDDGDDDGGGAAAGAGSVQATIDGLLAEIPTSFDMIELGEKAAKLLTGPHAPYVVLVVQECGRMNVLLEAMAASLDEVNKGLSGQLNITDAMEDLVTALSIDEVPGRNPFHSISWEKLAWPSTKSLSGWFTDVLLRVAQLSEWQTSMMHPVSTWLPGLGNPTAFLTAVKQVSARANTLPLDNMTVETHITVMQTYEDATEQGQYAPDGAFVHGLYIQGARWSAEGHVIAEVNGVECGGAVTESKLKELLPPMPVMFIKAVVVEATWAPTSVGYMRPEKEIYNCPVYLTEYRGPTFVFIATLRTQVGPAPWVLAGVALLMQTS